MIQVDFELCSGCGNCAAVCPSQAISIEAGKARIDAYACTQCEACLEACPTGAVSVVESLPVPVAVHPELIVPAGEPVGASGLARFAPAVGATLTYLGREVVPRLADVLFNVVEDRLKQPAKLTQPEPASTRRDRRQVRRRQRRRGLR